MQSSQSLPVVEDKDEAKREDSNHVDGQRQQEEEEVAVVPSSYAVVDPGTVVVKVLKKEEGSYGLEMSISIRYKIIWFGLWLYIG